jgi:glycosyltransferase involved in cell wall biosynthesis
MAACCEKIAVVIPAYNEVRTIAQIARSALNLCPLVIVVDDGSTDGTAETLKDLPVILLSHEYNMGKAASLFDGMQHALSQGVDGVITLDADGQHQPSDIPRFISAAEAYSDCIIIGSRLADKTGIPKKRYIANQVANFWISWAAGYRLIDSQSGFRYYPAALLNQIKIPHDKQHGFVFESEILIEAARQCGIKSHPLAIAAIYQKNARPSHFRSIYDVVCIIRMVAWKLLSRGFYLQGLYRAYFASPR